MRRRVGIQGLDTKKMEEKTFKQVGTEIQAAELSQVKDQLSVFHTNLEEFAVKHKKDINRDTQFRKYFQDMCTKVGVDPLASNKGFWSEVLGVGDFYYELAIQIIEVCLRTRSYNGGLIEIEELYPYLTKMRGKNSQSISVDDIERACKKLKSLGNGFQVLSIGSKKMIQSVPCELSVDHTALLSICTKGFFTVSMIEKELGWKKDRIDSVVDLLLKEGICWVDSQFDSGSTGYWIPSLVAGIVG